MSLAGSLSGISGRNSTLLGQMRCSFPRIFRVVQDMRYICVDNNVHR